MAAPGNLFIAALIPVLKVVIITLFGSFLALKRVNVLGMDARKHLNKAAFYVFTPALVVSGLVKNITFRNTVMLWFMPVNILITFIIGSFLGWLVMKITRAPRQLRGLVIGCCSAGNLGNLPLVLVPAICKEKGTPFGDSKVCEEHALSYVTLSLSIGAIYMWSYVYNIIRVCSTNTESDEARLEDRGTVEASNHDGDIVAEDVENGGCRQTRAMKKEPVLVLLVTFKKGLVFVERKLSLRRLVAPSTIAAIMGFIIGGISPFRKTLVGDGAPFRVIQDSAYLIGEASIPCSTLIVGANLLKGLKGGSVMKVPIIVGIVVARYIVLPIFGVVTVKAAVQLGFVRSSDPLYQFVLMLQFALPPAVGIGTMTQLFEAGQSECSVILLSMYALASVTLTLWSMFFMWLIGRQLMFIN